MGREDKLQLSFPHCLLSLPIQLFPQNLRTSHPFVKSGWNELTNSEVAEWQTDRMYGYESLVLFGKQNREEKNEQACQVGIRAVFPMPQLQKYWPNLAQSKSELPPSHHTHRHSVLSLPLYWHSSQKYTWERKKKKKGVGFWHSQLTALSREYQNHIKEASRITATPPAVMALYMWCLTTCKVQSWKHLILDIMLRTSLIP